MADPMPQRATSDEVYAAALSDIDRRLRELEAPGGTQRAQTMSDLLARATHARTLANMSVASALTSPPWGQQAFTFPAPRGGARSAIVLVNAAMNGTGNAASIFVEVRRLGGLLMSDTSGLGGGSTPAGWGPMFSGFAPVVVPAGDEPEFVLRLSGLQFTSGAGTVTLTNITAALIYGDKP